MNWAKNKKNANNEIQKKMPIAEQKIFKIMFWVTIIASSVFLIKNIIERNVAGSLVIGGCIAIFAVILTLMQVRKATNRAKQMVLSISLLVLICIIGISTGASYSDDFILYLAVIGMTGLYLEPKFALVQLILSDVCLIIMYVANPNKAESLAQYIQCVGEFTLAGILFMQTIKRGRAFIGIGEERAKDAEGLVNSMKHMGEELDRDFTKSSQKIDDNTKDLKTGSTAIVAGANNMNDSCNDVADCIVQSQQSIMNLNEEVIRFELALKENQNNMENMEKQLATVSGTIYEANEIFQAMEKKMGEVADIADQLGDISFNTSILSLNASIEAARAGETGAGFEVVATEMRQLSNNSNIFSEQVSEVVKGLVTEVGETAKQFTDSTQALEESKTTMRELQESFKRLNQQFGSLYSNIETQNSNVSQVGAIFDNLRARVAEMQKYSEDNQESVEAIVEAMEGYKININKVIDNTKNVEV